MVVIPPSNPYNTLKDWKTSQLQGLHELLESLIIRSRKEVAALAADSSVKDVQIRITAGKLQALEEFELAVRRELHERGTRV